MDYKTVKQQGENRTTLNTYKSTNKKLTNVEESIAFLTSCRKNGIIPNFIKKATKSVEHLFKTYNTSTQEYKQIHNKVRKYTLHFHKKILNITIKHNHILLKTHQKTLHKLTTKLENTLTPEQVQSILEDQTRYRHHIKKQNKVRLNEKLKALEEKQTTELGIKPKKEWFYNRTKTNFPDNVKWLLSLGQKHALPTTNKNFPTFNIIADAEQRIQTTKNKEEQEEMRANFTHVVENHLQRNMVNERDKFTIRTADETQRFLRQNKDILILEADKGNCTVAMEKQDYMKKMDLILNDIMSYRRINKDPTSSLQKKNNTIVNEMHERSIIDERTKRELHTETATAPRMYGVPKIHKPDVPLRPICSNINSPTYKLSKYLTTILKKLTKNSIYNVKDSIEFKAKLRTINIKETERMISLDVVSLFPSIPVDLAIKTIMDKWTEITKWTDLSKELFHKILTLCIKDSRYCIHNNKIYSQIKGLPMGSPASPIVADIVMEHLIQQCLEDLQLKPKLLTKYVDDLFTIVEERTIEPLLHKLNNYNTHIKFTIEKEINGQLPYLDCIINRNNGNISVDWYQKPTQSGRIINFHSKHHRRIVNNTAKNFIDRVLKISDHEFHAKNLDKIILTLKKNDFPNRLIKKFIHDRLQPKENIITQNTNTTYQSMTYVPGLFERLENTKFTNDQIKLAPKSNNTTKKFFSNTKQKTETTDQHNVVYKITCSGDGSNKCNKKYVGTTKNKLKTRLAQHKSDIKLRRPTENSKTALAAHCAKFNHTADLDNAKILTTEHNYHKRLIHEMLHIVKTPVTERINYKTDIDHCAQNYRNLINKHHNNNYNRHKK